MDEEERARTWWGVLLVDRFEIPKILTLIDTHNFRMVSIGNMGYIINSQEPSGGDKLPIDDNAWVGSVVSQIC